jgi:RHH-type proline utilization regulon transcriptional repressor/proline dehydrogenase/delta 1-pyrroline-5-carboxylate dehydrogenase
MAARALRKRLPASVREHVTLAQDWKQAGVRIAAALCHTGASTRLTVAQALAERPGPIVGLTGMVL